MSNFLQEKKQIMFFLILILFLLIGLGYIYIIKPLQDDLDIAKMNVQAVEAEVQLLNAQISPANEDNIDSESIKNIKKKLPTQRYLDDILIQLERVEKATKSKINSISFATTEGTLSESDNVIMRTGVNLLNSEENEQFDEERSDEESEVSADDAQNPPPAIPGVENIKYVQVYLSITSPDYTHLRQFLTELEKLERITRIDNYSFSDFNQKDAEGYPLPLSIDLQMSTYYFTGNQNK